MKIFVVCVGPEDGRHMAFTDGETRGWGFSEELAIVDLLTRLRGIEIIRIVTEAG